jgi:hypothetical protein
MEESGWKGQNDCNLGHLLPLVVRQRIYLAYVTNLGMPTVSSSILKKNSLKKSIYKSDPTFHNFTVLSGFLYSISWLLNQQTVVQFFRCKTKQTTLRRLLIEESSTQVQILPLFTKWSDKIFPPILTGLFHNTLHTLILAMLIAPFVYYLKSRFLRSHHGDS